jgi:hypothetical protein
LLPLLDEPVQEHDFFIHHGKQRPREAIWQPRAHDLRLLRGLWECLKEGGILLGARAFGGFTTLAGLCRIAVLTPADESWR